MENDILEFNGNKIVFRPISDEDKNMSNGMRDLSRTPLTDEEMERKDLIMDAMYRAKEVGLPMEMNDFMKEVVYGYTREERNIIGNIPRVNYIREQGIIRIE